MCMFCVSCETIYVCVCCSKTLALVALFCIAWSARRHPVNIVRLQKSYGACSCRYGLCLISCNWVFEGLNFVRCGRVSHKFNNFRDAEPVVEYDFICVVLFLQTNILVMFRMLVELMSQGITDTSARIF